MRIDRENLARLETEYKGYLKGDRLEQFFDDFGIKLAAGHWCAGDFADRFAPVGYLSNDPNFKSDVISQIERVAQAGMKGIEFHEVIFIDRNYKKDEVVIQRVKEALAKYKLIPTNMNTNLWTDPKWKLGGITNVNKSIREDALAIALQGIEIAKELGCTSVALWPGSDGWDYNFQVNYGQLLDRFVEGCIVINKKARQENLIFGVEAKLHEPREGNMIISTTHKAALVALMVNQECGGTNMGVCVDYGHEQMYASEPADMLYTLKRVNVPLTNFHINNAKLHSNDEDRISGTGDNWRLADFCYAAVDTGYKGWFGEDQYTYRMEPVKAMALSRELFANIMKKALQIYANKKALEVAQSSGKAEATIDVVKEYLI